MLSRRVIAGMFFVSLCGCLATRHVEGSRIVTVEVDHGGGLQVREQAEVSERSWRGPWIVQPDRASP
jgi:hypothetical protein